MVRLVFRPYTHIRRSICTSESLRASTRVSSGFTLCRHSSPSFGSQPTSSTSDQSEHTRWHFSRVVMHFFSFLFFSLKRKKRKRKRNYYIIINYSLSFRQRVYHSKTRLLVALLGPCFKTGRFKPFCQQPLYPVYIKFLGKNQSFSFLNWNLFIRKGISSIKKKRKFHFFFFK